jgi:small-conductance mechanosensitive channel
VAFFFFAFVANVVGYCGLANFLGDSMLASTYLALILYATTRIAKGLWAFALRAWPLNLLHVVKRHEALMVRRIGLILDWLAGLLWLYESLDLFNIRDVVIEWIRRAMAATLAIGSISLSVGHVLAFAATIWVTFQVSRLARFLLEEDVFDRFDLPSGVPYAISRTLHYVILVWGFCIAVAALGYDMTKFTFLVGAFGVGLGFGMQNIVNNFVSGIILLFERPIKVGDVIQMNDTTGIVEHIGIRASVMQTPEGAEIIVPNGTLISNQVTNWTLSNGRRAVVLPISIAPVPDPNEVIKVLKETAQSHPRVLANPPVQVMVTKISADALGLEIHAWTEGADNWVQLRSELALAIFAAASKHGINLK